MIWCTASRRRSSRWLRRWAPVKGPGLGTASCGGDAAALGPDPTLSPAFCGSQASLLRPLSSQGNFLICPVRPGGYPSNDIWVTVMKAVKQSSQLTPSWVPAAQGTKGCDEKGLLPLRCLQSPSLPASLLAAISELFPSWVCLFHLFPIFPLSSPSFFPCSCFCFFFIFLLLNCLCNVKPSYMFAICWT